MKHQKQPAKLSTRRVPQTFVYEQTLIFIHKTFGEFAAGRHLAAMPLAARMSALSAIGTDNAWDEVLSFNEDPYPTHGGVIPNSPRDKIAGASAAISAPDYNRLKLYVSDSRSDVREVGTKMLVERLREQADLASTFLTDIEEGRLAAHMLDNALAAGMNWDEATLARIETLLASPRVELCYAAMASLHAPYRAAEVIRDRAMKLVKHSNSQIRERAYRILDGAPKSA